MKLKAHTLAEVFIVLTVIGVISLIIIPFVSDVILTNTRARQTVAAKHKLAKAVENMALNGDIGPYYGTGEDKTDATDAFVRRLSNYYKINKICTTTNLEECWGYDYIKFPSGENYNIQNAVNGRLFKNGGSNSLSDDFDVETRGILATDGTRYIIAYNKNCEDLPMRVYNWSSDGSENEAMACVSAILDIDGSRAPNRVGKDISFINATGIGNNCIVEIGDACFGALFVPSGVTKEECEEHKDDWGLTYCAGDNYTHLNSSLRKKDVLAGVAKSCGKLSSVVSSSDMYELIKEVKENGNNYSDYNLPSPNNASNGVYIIVGEEVSEDKIKTFLYQKSGSTSTQEAVSRAIGYFISGNVYSFCKIEE